MVPEANKVSAWFEVLGIDAAADVTFSSAWLTWGTMLLMLLAIIAALVGRDNSELIKDDIGLH